MTVLQRWKLLLWDNPVTLKELRVGLRERRMLVLQLLFLLLLLGVTLLSLPQFLRDVNAERLASAGHDFFFMLFGFQLATLLFIAPALTCGSLSGERERHSLDMVLASRLSSAELVVGKLGFAVYCLVLLLSSTLPLSSVAFFLGGVSAGEALTAYTELFVISLLAACIGLFASAREQRSNYATVQAYLSVLLASFSLPFYLALRYDNGAPKLPVGTGAWQFDLTLFHFMLGVAAYLVTFICLKARHRLRPQATTIRWMAISFILLYLYCHAWVTGAMVHSMSPSNDFNDILPAYFSAHLLALGFFLNPANLDSSVERARHRKSLLSRPVTWITLCALGLAIPIGWGALWSKQSDLTLYGPPLAFFLCLLHSINAYWIYRLTNYRWQFAWVYYILLGALASAPVLGAFSDGDGYLKLYFVSPLSTLWSLADSSFPSNTPALAVMFQIGLCVLLAIVNALKQARQRRRSSGA